MTAIDKHPAPDVKLFKVTSDLHKRKLYLFAKGDDLKLAMESL
jgi:hypothetical protein